MITKNIYPRYTYFHVLICTKNLISNNILVRKRHVLKHMLHIFLCSESIVYHKARDSKKTNLFTNCPTCSFNPRNDERAGLYSATSARRVNVCKKNNIQTLLKYITLKYVPFHIPRAVWKQLLNQGVTLNIFLNLYLLVKFMKILFAQIKN